MDHRSIRMRWIDFSEGDAIQFAEGAIRNWRQAALITQRARRSRSTFVSRLTTCWSAHLRPFPLHRHVVGCEVRPFLLNLHPRV
jgi:hypothetical protein